MCAAVGIWHQASAIALMSFVKTCLRLKVALYYSSIAMKNLRLHRISNEGNYLDKLIRRQLRCVTKISHPYCQNSDIITLSTNFGA